MFFYNQYCRCVFIINFPFSSLSFCAHYARILFERKKLFDFQENFAIDFWLKPTADNDSLNRYLMAYQKNKAGFKLFINKNNKLVFSCGNGEKWNSIAGSLIKYNEWEHVLISAKKINETSENIFYN